MGQKFNENCWPTKEVVGLQSQIKVLKGQCFDGGLVWANTDVPCCHCNQRTGSFVSKYLYYDNRKIIQ